MMRNRLSVLAVMFAAAAVLAAPSLCLGQLDKINFTAGTPEDKDLNAISNEQDAQKRIAMYQDFLQKYASNPQAVAYGNWQLEQTYQAAGDLQKAAEAGDKAASLSPHNLDILTTNVTVAQGLKDNARSFKYAIQGAEAYDSIDKQAKPADVSDEQFKNDISQEKDDNKNAYEFYKNSAFAVLANETDPKTRMDEIEKFTATFPKSGMDDQLASFAMLALSELKDNQRLIEYAEKALAANPDNLAALILLANTYVDSPAQGSLGKAITYAERAVVAAKADDPAADKSKKISAGVAHSVLGRAYAKQQKTQQSIAELKSAISLLKGQDEQQFAIASYYLGFDYAKLSPPRLTEARAALNDALSIPGPVQGPAKELLGKVNSARAAGK